MREALPVRLLDLSGENLPIDDKLRRAVYSLDDQTGDDAIQLPDLPAGLGSVREVWDMLNPWGTGGRSCAHRTGCRRGARPTYRPALKVRKAGLYIPILPFPLSDIRGGEITLKDGVLDVQKHRGP